MCFAVAAAASPVPYLVPKDLNTFLSLGRHVFKELRPQRVSGVAFLCEVNLLPTHCIENSEMKLTLGSTSYVYFAPALVYIGDDDDSGTCTQEPCDKTTICCFGWACRKLAFRRFLALEVCGSGPVTREYLVHQS